MKQVIILLSTYNGEKYLKEQLNSLFAQTYQDIKIIARDDGSSDNTVDILKQYDIELIDSGCNLGAKKSFEVLLKYAINNTKADYFMFCDQDDVWNKNKVEKSLMKIVGLEKQYSNMPILVHTDLTLVDEKLNLIHFSFWKYAHVFPYFNSFNRLLVQNCITGCTMMINKNLAKLSLPIADGAIMHDWWIGLVASKFGKISSIEESTILYRQHNNNTIGAKGFDIATLISKIYKRELYIKNITHTINQAKFFLEQYRDRLDKYTIDMLEEFIYIDSKTFWQKREIIIKYKLFKQGFLRNIGMLSII